MIFIQDLLYYKQYNIKKYNKYKNVSKSKIFIM